MPKPAKALATINEAADMLSLGRTKMYDLMQPKGPLPVLKIGKSVRIPISAIESWIEDQIEAGRDAG